MFRKLSVFRPVGHSLATGARCVYGEMVAVCHRNDFDSNVVNNGLERTRHGVLNDYVSGLTYASAIVRVNVYLTPV